jgi:hypothetical protein
MTNQIVLTEMIAQLIKIIISNTTRGYEIAGNFRSHYTA